MRKSSLNTTKAPLESRVSFENWVLKTCNSWKSYYSACCGKVSTQQDKLNSAEYILYSVGLPSPLKS